MKNVNLKYSSLPDEALFDILNRDAALWISEDVVEAIGELEQLARLMLLPWKLVLCESSSSRLAAALDQAAAEPSSLVQHRGFLHVIAANPATRSLPARALPIYFLNGRDGAPDRAESSALTGMASSLRRLNMLERLFAESPKRLVLVGGRQTSSLDQLDDLWSSGYRSRLTFVVPEGSEVEAIATRCERLADLSSISIVTASFDEFASDIIGRGLALLPDANVVLRIRDSAGTVVEVDVTSAELPEQPVLDHYEVIKSKDLRRLTESDLTVEDIDVFFGKGDHSWRAYAAGLPWTRDATWQKTLLNALVKVAREGSARNKIFYVVSEAGAGGTTLARQLAFEAASNGFPTLLARSHVYEPDATELVSFFNRVRAIHGRGSDDTEVDTGNHETPWFLVFDRDQWDGQEKQIESFLSEFARSGRSVVLLKILGSFVPADLPPGTELAFLSHELDRDQAISLGEHLNRYLKPFGRGKNQADWERFWEQHKPDIDNSIAAFWITLDFWLRGLIDIGESVQSWLLDQFRKCPIDIDLKKLLLEIASLTIERRSVPEQLLPFLESTRRPLSMVLEDIRTDIPALALIRQSTPDGRLWAMAHDVLGRYLVTACYHDRALMREIGLDAMQSVTELRLHLIGSLTRRTEMGERRFRSYAVQFAVKTLKLDEEGNAEFFPYWREVLRILDEFPKPVRDSSRTFNHHVAISRRRVAKGEMFGCSLEEKQEQVEKSIKQIEFALFKLEPLEGDESSLNLYNSLALAYQDLAGLKSDQGASLEEIEGLRRKASEATVSALKESPTNPYVLETAAKNLIQQGRLDNTSRVSCAAESLGYVFQAAQLESSAPRQYQLGKLATEALTLLRSDAEQEIVNLKAVGNPMGFLAEAWLELTKGQRKIGLASSNEFSAESARRALAVLSNAPRHWLIVRLQYDIVCALEPRLFEQQLALLDELEATAAYRLSLQLRLNQAILLHIVGRHSDGNSKFKALRGDIKSGHEIVVVPDNLRWLVGADGITRTLCTARVVDNIGYRPMATVIELKNAQVPFIAQDFGGSRMPPGMSFKCHINFGAMGPFIKPPVLEG